MSDADPLLSDDGTSLEERVGRLFGSAPREVVSAVDRFLASGPGKLDNVMLRLVAAAASSIDDASVVAGIIDEMAITRLDVAALPEMATARAEMERLLVRHPTIDARRQVVSGIVEDIARKHTTKPTLSGSVEQLFGSAPPVLVRAVAGFSSKDPGRLDICNLETIAAAAPAIDDPQQVARLIEEMPITHVYVAASNVDRHSARVWFGQILPRYPKTTRRQLVSDLIRRSNLELLTHMSPDRMPRSGREFLEHHLRDRLHGSIRDMAVAMFSPHATTEMIDEGLDEIERRIDRSESGTTNRTSHKMPLGAVADAFMAVFQASNGVVTERQALRSWGLARRCEMTDLTRSWLLESAARNQVVVTHEADALLEEIDRIESPVTRSELEHRLLADPMLPEAVAWLLAARMTNVNYFAAASDVGSSRLRTLRHVHYASGQGWTDFLPSPMTDEMLDSAVAELPGWALSGPLVSEIRTPTALLRLAQRADDLWHEPVCALIKNPALDFAVASDIYRRRLELVDPASSRQYESFELGQHLLRHPDADDATIEHVVKSVQPAMRNRLRNIVDDARKRHPVELAHAIVEGDAGTEAIDELIERSRRELPRQGFASAKEQREACQVALDQLADRGTLTDHHWEILTGAADRHFAVRYATHENCPADVARLTLMTEQLLCDTSHAVDNNLGRWPRRDRSLRWEDLPNRRDEPLPRSNVADMIDGKTVAGLELETPRTQRELDEVATRMGNCISAHVDGIRSGSAVVAWTRKKQQTFAAVWYVRQNEQLALEEINTDYNTGRVPDDLREAVDVLTGEVNTATMISRSSAVNARRGVHGEDIDAHRDDFDRRSDTTDIDLHGSDDRRDERPRRAPKRTRVLGLGSGQLSNDEDTTARSVADGHQLSTSTDPIASRDVTALAATDATSEAEDHSAVDQTPPGPATDDGLSLG